MAGHVQVCPWCGLGTPAAAPRLSLLQFGSELCGISWRQLGPAGALYTTHLRDESAEILSALEEAFAVGRGAGVPVVLSHHKVTGKDNFGMTTRKHTRTRPQSPLAHSTRTVLPVVDAQRELSVGFSESLKAIAAAQRCQPVALDVYPCVPHPTNL